MTEDFRVPLYRFGFTQAEFDFAAEQYAENAVRVARGEVPLAIVFPERLIQYSELLEMIAAPYPSIFKKGV